ncbi:MAG: replicative DNA helicase, partial [Maribacter sp.]|nr:replicative DNA helicase [Maribacter sp.]
GKFDNLDDFDSPFEFQSKMNADDENPFLTKNLPDANEAFGSAMNDDFNPDDNDVPF